MREWIEVVEHEGNVWLLLGDERADDRAGAIYEFILTPEGARALSSLLQDAACDALGDYPGLDEEWEAVMTVEVD